MFQFSFFLGLCRDSNFGISTCCVVLDGIVGVGGGNVALPELSEDRGQPSHRSSRKS